MAMTLKEAFFYAFNELDKYWRKREKHPDIEQRDDLGLLLTEMQPTDLDSKSDVLYTGDPASWGDWLQAVDRVTKVPINEVTKVRISKEEAKIAIIEMMKEYKNQGLQLDETINYFNQQLPKTRD